MMKLDQRKIARVLFDEYHSEAWSISPEVARQMQPEAPFDSSYAQAAQELARRDFAVARNADSPLTAELLHQADVLIIAHPSERKWERTTNTNSPRLADDEIAAIRDFVRNGGGLIVLGETEQDKYGNNLNDLLAEFGVRVENATVFDYAHYHRVTSWILAQPSTNGVAKTGLLNRVRRACLYRAGVLSVHHCGHRPRCQLVGAQGCRQHAAPVAERRWRARHDQSVSRPGRAIGSAHHCGDRRA